MTGYDMETMRRLFEKNVVRADGDECWAWTGGHLPAGYGSISLRRDGRRTSIPAHRAAHLLFIGPIPEGYEIDHLCRTRECVRPSHLEAVTPTENKRRSIPFLARGEGHHHGAKTHCPQGHPYDEANTYELGGHRYCIECNRERKRQARRERAA